MSNSAGSVTHRKIDDIFILELPAHFSAEAGTEANRWVEWGLADSPGVVIVDFAKTRAADADAIPSLNFLFDRAAEVDIEVGLTGMNDTLRGLMETAGFVKRARTFATVDDAVAEM